MSKLSFNWTIKPNARRKRVAIYITADGEVELRTPLRFSQRRAERFLHDQAPWVEAQLAKRKSKPVKQTDVVRLFGEDYRVTSSSRVNTERDESERMIYLAAKDSVEAYQRRELQRVIELRLALWLEQIKDWPEQPAQVRIRAMKTRWGSCSSKRNINLSLMLVHHPIELIDYVIVHELCHLKEMNHSRAYWRLVESLMPDWKLRRAALNSR